MKLWKCMKCKGFFWLEPGPFTREHHCKDCGGVLMPHVEKTLTTETRRAQRNAEKK